jgi:Phosphotransferase enzyme family
VTRIVTLALTDGRVLPAFEVAVPWWQEMVAVVDGAREHHGLDVSVLRILQTEPGRTNGGKVTYLASVEGDTSLGTSDDHPLRPDYAKPGGPARSIAWARSALDVPITTVEQQRTWNLSAIWKLGTPRGTVWLKQVPHFFRHEAAVLRHLGRPRLLASDDEGRMLIEDIPGEDLYDADFATLLAIAGDCADFQLEALSHVDALRAAGVPGMLPLPRERELPRGLPDTLVHGDLHSGNVCGTPAERTIIDWGDSFIGHPGFDILRLGDRIPREAQSELMAYWAKRWQRAVPGCDPVREAELLRPIAALRNAAVYANFLANIEPSEHPYHAADVPLWMAEADRWESLSDSR